MSKKVLIDFIEICCAGRDRFIVLTSGHAPPPKGVP